ncbi:class Ib ribonucleoside-diphosphate reductase assembly flavoprotein NrdI [Marinilactibacillus kalidii]|uniref:class Ib ribonucleoside-diphosphate reductase assembly flavoprotein NrdI n=1 Tax=Marinilactibacillus kalidii TaxID=2820274 RepID=UPI001ABE8878|nr:class Ib ribonucleoside-diphosphate reductase assembly flavoprotein NrdI [Marinilactibacillus kalidii]
MNKKIKIIYISLSGNTAAFVKKLSTFLTEVKGIEVESINVKDLMGDTFPVTEPFVSFLPTYLSGGNGVQNGDKEVMTTNLGEFIAAHENFRYCYGIIGSGNRNLNKQFCLSAKQYAERFGFPLIEQYELRGTSKDVERIAEVVLNQHNSFIETVEIKAE